MYIANRSDEKESCRIVRKDLVALKDDIFAQSESTEVLKLPEDTYTFIMFDPISRASAMAVIILCMQMTIYSLIISNSFIVESVDGAKNNRIINVPFGATRLVHTGQGIAIFLVFILSDGLWESCNGFLTGFNKDLEEHNITFHWWFFSNFMRLSEGIISSIVFFFIIVQSDNIVTLFKDFAAMTFISSLDNVAYTIVEMGVLGKTMKSATEREDIIIRACEVEQSDKELSRLKTCFKTPIVILFCWMVLFYSAWAWIAVVPQIHGNYLCQKIYIQLGDGENQDLPFFSGVYELDKSDGFQDSYATRYTENKISLNNNRIPVVVRYCFGKKYWIFTFSSEDECENENRFLVKSETVNDQTQFDLLMVPDDAWSARHNSNDDTDTFFLLSHAPFVQCIDKESVRLSLPPNLCENIETDERKQFGNFTSARNWSNQFQLLKKNDADDNESGETHIKVHDHPVYYSDLTDQRELIFFTGSRWALTTTDYLEKEFKSITELGRYLEREFNCYYSNFTSVFVSETVSFDTPSDTMSPVGLWWYNSYTNSKSSANLNSQVTPIFICSRCDNSANPCFFTEAGNTCQEDGTCRCHESTGTLCQVIPSGDGRCNNLFNSPEFNYDGGDCCIDTCINKGNQICGYDPSGDFFVGYDSCLIHKVSENSSLFERYSDKRDNELDSFYQMSLSPSGRVLALVAKTGLVYVYDKYGSQWVTRNAAITRVAYNSLDSLEVSCHYDLLNSLTGKLSPLTVAIGSRNKISIYDWNIDSMMWDAKSEGINSNNTAPIKESKLRNEGKTLGVLYSDGSFTMFRRRYYDKLWIVKENMRNITYEYFELSNGGNIYALANQDLVEVYEYGVKHEYSFHNPSKKIRNVSMSPNGKFIALEVDYEQRETEYTLLHLSAGILKEKRREIRDIGRTIQHAHISNDGKSFAIHSGDNQLTLYRETDINGDLSFQNFWHRQNVREVSISLNQEVLVVIPDNQGVATSTNLDTYHSPDAICPMGSSTAHLTFLLDESIGALSWEIFYFKIDEYVKVLAEGGPYEMGETSITRSFCVANNIIGEEDSSKANDSCISIKIKDLELNGLRSPGTVGIAVGGKVKWSIKRTDGYEDIFKVFGTEKCFARFKETSHWAGSKFNSTLHAECRDKQCGWVKTGKSIKSFSNFGLFSSEKISKPQPLSLSAGGFSIALNGEYVTNNDTAIINVYDYSEQDGWTPRGPLINGDKYDKFGWSKCLSADGTKIAVGAPYSSSAGNNSGKVLIYSYDTNRSAWLQLGNPINGKIGSRLGYSVKLSADGTIVAISSASPSITCHVHVFVFDNEGNTWIQLGQCIDALLGYSSFKDAYYTDLSSNGLVVSVGVPYSNINDMNAAGHVAAFQYNEVTDKWEQLGSTLLGTIEYGLTGISVSLSANGSTLAIGCHFNSYMIVYQYSNDRQAWEQLGTEIPTITSIASGIFEVALSSEGSHLIASTKKGFVTYVYNERNFAWEGNTVWYPAVENLDYLPFAASADGITVATATRHQNQVDVWRLEVLLSKDECDDGEYDFKFEISPDRFSYDIAWFLSDQKGNLVMGGYLPIATEGESIPKYSYDKCIPKVNAFYTFAIYDSYGDGICCNWGNGNFTLELDSNFVVSNDGFLDVTYACLPKTDDLLRPLELYIIQQTETLINWNLLDSKFTKICDESKAVNPVSYATCQRVDECFTFALTTPQINTNVHLSFGDEIQKNITNSSLLEVLRVGDCVNEIKEETCPAGYKRFLLNIYTDSYPEEAYWGLIDTTDTIFASSSNTSFTGNQYHRISSCISEDHKCLFFVSLDSWGDGGATFSVLWDENESFEYKMDRAIQKTSLRDRSSSVGCSRQVQCEEGHAHFEIDYIARGKLPLSWFEVQNERNVTFIQGEEHSILNEYKRQHACLPIMSTDIGNNQCWTFKRNVIPFYLGEIYQIVWNGQVMKIRRDGGFEAPYMVQPSPFSFGNCSST